MVKRELGGPVGRAEVGGCSVVLTATLTDVWTGMFPTWDGSGHEGSSGIYGEVPLQTSAASAVCCPAE